MFIVELTEEQCTDLLRIMTSKAKEISYWKMATGSDVRDDEYRLIVATLAVIKKAKEVR